MLRSSLHKALEYDTVVIAHVIDNGKIKTHIGGVGAGEGFQLIQLLHQLPLLGFCLWEQAGAVEPTAVFQIPQFLRR